MKNSRITGLTTLPMALVSTVCAAERSNVVYIMTDQQSYYMISEITKRLGSDPYAGNPYFSTPNLDRLVKNGYTFSNCYAANAVSGPSRFALLTGESPKAYGMKGNYSPGGENGPRIMSLVTGRAMGTLFKNAGYQTYYAGKVHLPWADGRSGKGSINDAPYKYGFDHFLTPNDRDILAEKGAAFFSEYKDAEPFLLFLSFMNPHDICMTQLLFNNKQIGDFDVDEMEYNARLNQIRWRGVYNEMDKSQFRGDKLAKLPFNLSPTDRTPLTGIKQGNHKFDDYKMRVHIWFYYRLVEQVDGEIGQVLDALEKSPYKDNTLIVFTSDHGEMACSHGMVGKNIPYEECQKVPLIFAGKGIRQNVFDNTTPVCNGWDLLPTMLDMAGIEKPAALKGSSLYGTITTGSPVNRRFLYTETEKSYGVVDGGRYKYNRFDISDAQGGNETLFDLEKDPGELHNLAYDKKYAAKLKELRGALSSEMAYWGTSFDPIPAPGEGVAKSINSK